MPRLLLLALVVVGLAPGTFLRAPTGARSDPAAVTIVPLASREGVSGRLALTGVWELSSPHGWFGGFSALATEGHSGLIAGTDRGFLLDIDLTAEAPRARPGSFRFVGLSGRGRREFLDLESLTRDPLTETLWAGLEGDNLVVRFARNGTRRVAAPPAMRKWRRNSGPEAMVRLTDGRFLALAEGTQDGSDTAREALLFSGDPVAGSKPLTFRFVAPAGYDPVDLAQLPDGRVLILLRRVRYAIPASFDTAVALADPRGIRAGAPWQGRVIQRFDGGIFADNFEGIAYVPSATNPARGAVWIITDDNFSVFQRSLLVRLDWDGTPIP